ncbi:MAG: MmcQ/YjbR family DNA-binding protein [Dermatophilus congolensis]|nr:MmcQ/YjbR family DNA-binding protein [Dermatophilus congolensis]
MDAETLRQVATEQAADLPGSELEYPFDFDTPVYKVRGKMFLFVSEVGGRLMVTVKADPRDSEALRHAHPDITPGYHMNKRHWITLSPGDSLDEGLVRDIVVESYLLVVARLPRATRPVDPKAFGIRSPGGPS